MLRAAWDACGYVLDEWLALPLGTRIRLCASQYVGWGYLRDHPHVAYYAPGLPNGLADELDKATNCSTLTASIVCACFPDECGEDADLYGDLQVYADRYEAGIYDSPCLAVERVKAGERVDKLLTGRWHLIQGWRRLGSKPSGHAFLVFVQPDGSGLLVLEAASIGPRWRTTTLAGLATEYPAGLHAAVLTEV